MLSDDQGEQFSIADAAEAVEKLNELVGYDSLGDDSLHYSQRADGDKYALMLVRPIDANNDHFREDMVREPLPLAEHLEDLRDRIKTLGRRHRGADLEEKLGAAWDRLRRDMMKRWYPRPLEDLGPIISAIRAEGAETPGEIADELNERGISTPRGSSWTPGTAKHFLDRLDAME